MIEVLEAPQAEGLDLGLRRWGRYQPLIIEDGVGECEACIGVYVGENVV